MPDVNEILQNNNEEFLPDDKPIEKMTASERALEEAYSKMTGVSVSGLAQVDYVNKDKDPDKESEFQKLARDLKVSPDFVARNYDVLKTSNRNKDEYYENLTKNNPKISEWLANVDNHSVAKDDIDSLAKIEDAVKDHGFGSGLVDSFYSGMYKTASSLAKTPALMWGPKKSDLIRDPQTGNLKFVEYTDEEMAKQKPPESLYKNFVTEYLDKKAEENAPEQMSAGIIEEFKNGNYKNASKAWAYQVSSNLPQLALIIANPSAGLGTLGLSSVSGKYAENVQKEGVSEQTARINALATGAIETGIEAIGGIGSSGFKESIKSVVKGLGKQGAKEVFKEGFKQIAKSGAGEGIEEFATSISQDLVDYGSGVNENALDGIGTRAANSFLVGAGSGGLMTASVMTTTEMTKRFQERTEAQANREAYDQIGQIAKESKLGKRSLDKLKDVIDSVTGDTKIKDIFIPLEAMETYFQSKNIPPVKAAEDLGIRQQYEVAKETGAPITMPLSEWVTKTQGTEHYEGLSNDVKFDPEQKTQNEIKQEQKEIEDDLTRVKQEALDKGYDIEESAKEVGSSITEQLKNTGMKEADAKTYAKIYESTFKSLGLRTGLDPKALFAQYGLRINNQQVIDSLIEKKEITAGEFNQNQINEQITRAEKAGYDTSKLYYHGTRSEFDSFEITNVDKVATLGSGVYLSENKELPSAYASKGGKVLELYIKDSNKIVESGSKITKKQIEIIKKKLPKDLLKSMENNDDIKPGMTIGSFFRKLNLQTYNHNSMYPENYIESQALSIAEALDITGLRNEPRETIIFNPKNIKSKDALFKEFESGNIYSQGDVNDPRGRIQFGENGINIEILKGADKSTFIHETGHFYLEVLKDLASKAEAKEEIKNDYKIISDWLGGIGEKVSVEQHEQFARGFEAYFMEGKSPSSELKRAFIRMKTWMIQVYRDLRNLNVELTDDVRGVFDRLLVAENATNQAMKQADFDMPMISDMKKLGLTDKESGNIIQAQEDSRIETEELMSQKVIEDYKKTQTAEYKKRRSEIENIVSKDVYEMPVYKLYDHLKSNKNPDGTSKLETDEIKFNKAMLEQLVGKDKLQKYKGLYSVEDGIHPDAVSQLYGYETTQDMLTQLEGMVPKSEFIKQASDELMKKEYPEISNTISEEWDAVNEAIAKAHNDKRGYLLRKELEYIAKNNLPALKSAIQAVAKKVPNDVQVKEQAANIIAGTKVNDLKPNFFRQQETKYRNLAAKLLTKGDFDGAFDAKKKEYLNFELYRSSLEAKQDVEKSVKAYKKLFRSDEDLSKTRDVDLVNAARAILAEYGITKSEKKAGDYLQYMSKYDPDTYNMVSDLVESATFEKGFYKDVSYDKFTVMNESVKAIWDLSKSVREVEIDGKKIDKDVLKAELINQIESIKGPSEVKEYEETITKWGKFKEKVTGLAAGMKRVEHWADAMDVKFNGPFRRYIFQPISDSVTRYRLRKETVLKQYHDMLESYRANLKPQVIESKELGFKFKGKSELMMAILHTGNESNLQKLLIGRNWGEFKADGSLDTSKWDQFIERMYNDGTITKTDMDFAQSVWDLLESVKPEAQKAHKRMYGHYFNEITAKEFNTPFGSYRGGYIPAKVDVYANEDAAIRAEAEAFESNNNSFQFPTTGRGFTKSRVENYAAQLTLDMNMLGSHIDSVLRFSHIEPMVKEVARLISDKEFRSALSQVDTNVAKDAIIPWLQRAARQQTVLPSEDGLGRAMDAAAKFFRRNVATQIMFGNVTNTLQQITGLVVAMTKVKPRHIRNGLISYVTDNKNTVNSIMEKSQWMKSTQGSNIFEVHQSVNEILTNPTVFENIRNFTQKHTYFLQSAAQNLVNTIVWKGAYEQSIEGGMTDADAVRFADAAVRETQGSVNPEDVSRFETGTATAMLFKQFVGYFNMLANLNAGELKKIQREVGLKKGAGRAFYVYMMGFMLPAVASEMIVMAMSGKGFDQDDDDDYLDDALKAFFGSQFKTATAMAPFAGQVAVAAYNRAMTKEQYDDRLSLSPVISTIEGLSGVPIDLYKTLSGESDLKKKTVKDTLQLIGVLSGVPVGPIGKPIGYQMDVSRGKANPENPIDYARGLITGKSGK